MAYEIITLIIPIHSPRNTIPFVLAQSTYVPIKLNLYFDKHGVKSTVILIFKNP